MSSELNLSTGQSPRFFVRLEGWTDQRIKELAEQARGLHGVTKAAISAGSGMYIDYDSTAVSDAEVKDAVRSAAAKVSAD